MIVTYHKINPGQSPLLEPKQEVLPTRLTLPIGKGDPEYAAATIPINANRHQYSPAPDNPFFPHFLIPGIQNQIGVGFFQFPF